MIETPPLALVLTGASLGQSFLVAALLTARMVQKPGRQPLYLMAILAFFEVQIIQIGHDLILALVGYETYPGLTCLSMPLIPLLPICVWLYVRGLTENNPELGPRAWIYLLPTALCFLFYMPFFLATEDWKLAALTEGVDVELTELNAHDFILILGLILASLTWLGTLIVVTVKSIRRLRQHRRNIRALYSDLSGKNLIGLDILLWIILVSIGISIADELSMYLFEEDLLGMVSGSLYELLVTAAFGYFGLLYEPPLKEWSKPVLDPKQGVPDPICDQVDPDKPISYNVAGASDAAPNGPTTVAASAGRYARSALTEQDCRRLMGKIDGAMRKSRLWRDHFLSLKDLSETTGISPNHISQTLNSHLGRNFYDYVNGYRVEEACDLLCSGSDTVLTISETVGFNSKSTFNAAFRKLTGKTPTQYRNAPPEHRETAAVRVA